MSIFPFIYPEAKEGKTEEKLPLFKEYAYDFEKKCLKKKDGKTYLVSGNEALRIWIFFALSTSRYKYTAHSLSYGSEIRENVMGEVADELLQSEIERYITEALMVNPYIEELSEFSCKVTAAGLSVTFLCRTVYGEETENFIVEGVI